MARPQANNVTLDFTVDHGPGIISIPRALSLLNRKSYRAGYVYSVDYIEYIGHAGDSIRTGCLPCSYPLFAAFNMGFETWKQQRANAIEDTGLEPGKWSDFKPWYSLGHLLGPPVGGFSEYLPHGIIDYGLNLSDLDGTGSEWNMAELVFHDSGVATTTQYFVGMLGDDDPASFYGSLMDAYGDTRPATLSPDPLTPNVAQSSWITKTGEESAEMSEDVIQLIEDENDRPPYANQNDITLPPTYVGNGQSAKGGLLLDMSVTGTTGRSVSLSGGLLPLGYLIFNAVMANTENVATMRIHCTRGTYKGVAALPMGDFN